MGKVSKWDLFDVMFVHEDGYTNCLEYIFENSKYFRKNFSNLVFGIEVDGLSFKTRTVYRRTDSGANKQDVPDIVLYNADYFAIIEVKVDASEGWNQTQRYYDYHEKMIEALGITPKVKRFMFLTKYGSKPGCEQFDSISWSKIGECIDERVLGEHVGNTMFTEVTSQLSERIKTLNGKEIKLTDKWNDVMQTDRWFGAINLYKTLMMIEEFKRCNKLPSEYSDFWDGYDAGTNEYNYSALFTPDISWNGKTLDEVIGYPEEFCLCYQLHFEFKYNANTLLTRLDYHLNPYYSRKDVKSITDPERSATAQKCNKIRNAIAHKCKPFWKSNVMSYNAKITNEILSLLTKETTISKEDTVKDVLSKVSAQVKEAMAFANEVVLPTIRDYKE